MPRLIAAAVLLLAGMPSLAQTLISMWVHTGPGRERDAYAEFARDFNAGHPDVKVKLIALREGGKYNEQVSAAAAVDKLPCVLDFDGPLLYAYASSGKIVPLDAYPIARLARERLLPTLLQQGSYEGRLYSVAQYDSGLALFGSRRRLQQVGARLPKGVADAWTLKEFEDLLHRLKAAGVAAPLDMKFNYGPGEWMSYGFAPLLQSFGGDLVDRRTLKAGGTLNGPESVKALATLQRWVQAGLVDAGSAHDDDFTSGRSALSWVGHWAYPAYHQALAEDLVLLPMPRFGARAATGAGSWNFAISRSCGTPEAAAQVLEALISTPEILRVAAANAAVPATLEAQAASPLYGKDGPLRLYIEQARLGVARVRPQTPAYPVISAAFGDAVRAAVKGADVQAVLDQAAARIDAGSAAATGTR